MTPEGQVKDKIKAVLREFGAWYCMPLGQMYGRRGVPDFVVCYKGLFLGIEAKTQGKKPTELQKLEGQKVQVAGGLWIVISSEEEAETVLREVLRV